MFLHMSVIVFRGGGIPACITGGIPACITGGIPACLAAALQGACGIQACLAGFQAHTQRGSSGVWPGGSPGPHPGGVQVHTQGGSPGPHLGGSPGPHPGGVSRPTPGGCIPACTEADPPPPDGYCCGRYASYWNAFLFQYFFSVATI